MSGLLVIGYGNTLRGDDAAGVLAARAVARELPEARVIEATALLPEFAEEIARAHTVVFLDADVRTETPAVRDLLEEEEGFTEDAHAFTAGALLHLAGRLYGAVPGRALLVGIPAGEFELGEALSPRTLRGIDEAVAAVRGIAAAGASPAPPAPTT